MMRINQVFPWAAFLLAITACVAASGATVPYAGEGILVRDGRAMTLKVWSDGIRTRREWTTSDGDTSYWYYDISKKLMWTYRPNSACMQSHSEGDTLPRNAKLISSEKLDGHPTQKFQVEEKVVESGKAVTKYATEWRATDLGGLVIQWKKADGSQFNLRNIVAGVPDATVLAFPSQCRDGGESQDAGAFAAQAPGGFRTVSFHDLSCKKLVALALTFEVPSDFEIREGWPFGCFAGRPDDLTRLLKVEKKLQFDALQHAVIWLSLSETTQYDPYLKKFISDMGADDQWAAALRKGTGSANVSVTPKNLFGIPSLRVTAVVGPKTARWFFLGVADSPAIRISYQQAGNGTSADEMDWQRFLNSIRATK